MDSLCSSLLHPFSCSLRPIPIPNIFLPRTLLAKKPSPEPYFLRVTSHSHSHSSPKPVPSKPHLLLSLLKPISLTITIASVSFSILLFRFPSITPSLVLAFVSSPPAPTSDSPVQPDSDEMASIFRADIVSRIEQGDFYGSIKSLDRLISLQPSNLDLPLLKAHLQLRMGDAHSAKRSFERLLKKDPYLIEAHRGLTIILTSLELYNATELRELMKRVEQIIELCKKENDSKEKMRDFQLLLGQIKELEGEYEESLKVFEEMEKEDPIDVRPYFCQYRVYKDGLENKEEAQQQMKKYKRLIPQLHPYEEYFDNLVGRKIGEMEDAENIGSHEGRVVEIFLYYNTYVNGRPLD